MSAQKIRQAFIITLGIILFWPAKSFGQAPVGGPTTIGAQLGGLTEARGAEAVWINPALLGIFDGPAKSWSLLNFQGDIDLPLGGVELREAFKAPLVAGRVSITPEQGRGVARFSERVMGRNSSLNNSVHLIGLKVNGLALSAQSAVYLTPHVSERSARILKGDKAAIQEGLSSADLARRAEYSKYAAVSTAAVGLANNFGDLTKRAWGGITFKASQIHTIGIFRTQLADAESINIGPTGTRLTGAVITPGDAAVVISDLRLNKATLFGADIGIAMNLSGSSLLSVAINNIWQQNRVVGQREGFRHNVIAVTGLDSVGRLAATGVSTKFSGRAVPVESRGDAEKAINMAVFAPVARIGGSNELLGGRLTWGYAHILNGDDSMDRESLDKFSTGYYGAGMWSPRLSYGQKMEGQKTYSIGIARMGCGVRWGLGTDYIVPEGGQGRYGVSFGLSFGQGNCRLTLR